MLHLLEKMRRPFVFIINVIWKFFNAALRRLLGYLTILWGYVWKSPRSINSESLTDVEAEQPDETSNADKLMPHEKEYTRKIGKRDTDEKRQMELSDNGAQPQRLPHGLYNQGATCYLNSVLQVLVMTTEIHDRLDHELQTDQQLKQIFEELKRKTCTTETITAAFGIRNVCEQRDAPECLEMILNKISRRASEVFQGELTHTTECSKGHSINEETNPFWTLPLSLQDTHDDTTYSVERSFERIFQQKSFSGDNMVYCNECEEKTEATSGCEMVKYPQILTLLLKRFDFDYRTMPYFKSNCCVDVPRTLQIKDKKYKLYGMVNHIGSLRGGHYTATILCSEDNTWYEFNDAHVSKVRKQPFAETSTYKSKTAYLLMYRAISESPTDNALQKQHGNRKRHSVELERTVGERETDHEKKRRTGQNEEDDVQKKIHEASGHEAGGEKDAAPAAPKRGPLEMLAAWCGKGKKSKVAHAAAEQDKTAGACSFVAPPPAALAAPAASDEPRHRGRRGCDPAVLTDEVLRNQ